MGAFGLCFYSKSGRVICICYFSVALVKYPNEKQLGE